MGGSMPEHRTLVSISYALWAIHSANLFFHKGRPLPAECAPCRRGCHLPLPCRSFSRYTGYTGRRHAAAAHGCSSGGCMKTTLLLHDDEISRIIDRLASQIIEKHNDCQSLMLVGIQRRGVN